MPKEIDRNIFVTILFRCNKVEFQYKCPKCSIDYCSLTCFKDQKHSRCTEKFYQEQVRESLKSEKISELSDEREKMLKILEKLKNLDCNEDGEEEMDGIEEDHSEDSYDVVDDFQGLNLDELSVKEYEKLLGEHHLKKINELFAMGISQSWLDCAEITEPLTQPWFTRYVPSKLVLNEEVPDYVPVSQNEIPDLKSLTKKPPSDFLWNNLLEITVIYSFIYYQFSFNELNDSEIVKNEVRPVLMEICSTLLPSKGATFMSAIDALESSKSAIFFNSSEHNLNEILSGTVDLLNSSKLVLIMLSDMLSWFKTSKTSGDDFLAGQKIRFMLSWLNSEVKESEKSVDEILKTLLNIVMAQIVDDE